MKKKFFYLAMALCVAMTWTACGDDDDDNGSTSNNQWAKNVTLSKPKYYNYALDIAIKEAEFDKVKVTPSREIEDIEIPQITDLNFTEGGKVAVELVTKKDGKIKKSYELLPIRTVEDKDNNRYYTLQNGGEIVLHGLTLTRASQDISLSFTFTLPLSDGTSVTYTTDNVLGLAVLYAVNNDLIGYFARTWNVTGLMLETSGSVSTPFVRFSGGNLANVRDEAAKHGADFTAEEAAQFNKVISYVDVSYGQIYIGYNGGEVDACDYVSLNSSTGNLKLTVKDVDMGNKFLNNSSKASVSFEGDQCLLQLSTTVSGEKTYDATLSIQLKAAN